VAANAVYTYFGTVAKFNSDAATSGTTLNTNLAAGYGVQTVNQTATDPVTGMPIYLWVLQNGTLI
jgi:hypothetical protein